MIYFNFYIISSGKWYTVLQNFSDCESCESVWTEDSLDIASKKNSIALEETFPTWGKLMYIILRSPLPIRDGHDLKYFRSLKRNIWILIQNNVQGGF